ncbi:hypothetical protein FKM82_025955 [Ascaphus truei]
MYLTPLTMHFTPPTMHLTLTMHLPLTMHLIPATISNRTKDRYGSQPGNLDTLRERPLQSAQSDSNLHTAVTEASLIAQDQTPPPLSPIFRTGSDPVLRAKGPPPPTWDTEGGSATWGSDGQLHSKAPPKPLRAPSLLFSEPSEDRDTYSELVPHAPVAPRRHVDALKVEERWRTRARVTETTFGFLESEGSRGEGNPGGGDAEGDRTEGSHAQGGGFVRPQIQTTSSFQPTIFSSLLLTPENKPLEPSALRRLKEIVSQRDCRESALHILREDCQVPPLPRISEYLLLHCTSGYSSPTISKSTFLSLSILANLILPILSTFPPTYNISEYFPFCTFHCISGYL